jgi:cell division ATPase FtsA
MSARWKTLFVTAADLPVSVVFSVVGVMKKLFRTRERPYSQPDDIIAGLDMGTTNTVAVVGRRDGESVEIIGHGTHPSEGMRGGAIVDIAAVCASIRGAMATAEHMARCRISTVFFGLTGRSCTALASGGRFFFKNAKRHIESSARRCHLEIADLVPCQIAAADSALTDAERAGGVALVDVGAGATKLAVYARGSLIHTAVIALGGERMTRDIAAAFRTSRAEAERIKVAHGAAMVDWVGPGETIALTPLGGRAPRVVPRRALVQVIASRVEEISALLVEQLRPPGFTGQLPRGLVITGGAALLPGLVEVCGRATGLPSRLGVPSGLPGMQSTMRHPMYATALGLLVHGARFEPEPPRPSVVRELYVREPIRRIPWGPGMTTASEVDANAAHLTIGSADSRLPPFFLEI